MAESSVFPREVFAGVILVSGFLSVCSLCFCAEKEDIANVDSPMGNLTFIEAKSFTFCFYNIETRKVKIGDGNVGFCPRKN